MMVQVSINGEAFSTEGLRFDTFEDLLNCIKSRIAPDQVLVAVQLDGSAVNGPQWRACPIETDGELAVATADKLTFLCERLAGAEAYLAQVRNSFAGTIRQYQEGDSSEANTSLARSVDELLAFIHWYLSVLTLDPVHLADHIQAFHEKVDTLQEICERLVEPQMYKSNWVLAQTLEGEFLPALASFRLVCRRAAEAYQ